MLSSKLTAAASTIARYLLRDEFFSDLAAGNINGTAAEPGVGTRTLTDTSNRISIKYSEMLFNGAGSTTDPVARWNGVTRQAGLCFIATLRQDQVETTAQMVASVGWDANNSGQVDGNRFRFNTVAALEIATAGYFGSYTNVGTYQAMKLYTIAVIILQTKAAFCIKGGAWTEWTLLGSLTLNAATTLYPAIAISNRSAAIKNMAIALLKGEWLLDSISNEALSASAKAQLDAVAPISIHTKSSLESLFTSPGTQVGIERSSNDYWIWQDIGDGYRWYVQLEAITSPSVIHALDKSEIRQGNSTVETVLNESGSVWEYAISVPPSGFVGNRHGYDTETSLSVSVDGTPITLNDGESASGNISITIVRQSTTTTSLLAPLCTMVTTYTMSPTNGLTVLCEPTWAGSPYDADVGMMPFSDTGADMGFVLDASGKYYDQTLYSGVTINSPVVTAPGACAFKRTGNTAMCAISNDGNRTVWIQDRGTALNKIYMDKVAMIVASTTYRVRRGSTSDLLR